MISDQIFEERNKYDAYIAKENVWKVFSQSWSALPRSSLRRGRILTEDMALESRRGEVRVVICLDRREDIGRLRAEMVEKMWECGLKL